MHTFYGDNTFHNGKKATGQKDPREIILEIIRELAM